MQFHIRNRLVVIGYNSEPTLRFGRKREQLFTAYGVWPLLIGVGKARKGLSREQRALITEINTEMATWTKEQMANAERIMQEIEAEDRQTKDGKEVD
jgi:hypothetical protein